MLIIALVLALIGLVALVFAVVTSNELVAWVCIGASVLGVVLLIIDAVRERQRRDVGEEVHDEAEGSAGPEAYGMASEEAYVDYPEELPDEGESEVGSGVYETLDQTLDETLDETFDETDSDTLDEADSKVTEESTVAADGHGDDPAK